MSDERWSLLIAIIFSPIGWVSLVCVIGAIGFLMKVFAEIASGNKMKKRRDGRNQENC